MKIKKYAYLVIFISCLSSVQTLKAQTLQEIGGTAITTMHYEHISGTPFLDDAWSAGVVKLANGNTYKDNLFLKYNIKDDELYFKGKNDEMLAFVDPVVEFTIDYKQAQKHYKNGYGFIDGYTKSSFFEIIADGTVKLLKKTKKVILESAQYNSATVDKSFDDINQYFIVKNDKATIVKKDEKSFLAAIGDKQAELSAYIKANKLSFKNDADMAKLIIYYNSL